MDTGEGFPIGITNTINRDILQALSYKHVYSIPVHVWCSGVVQGLSDIQPIQQ